MLSNVGTNTAMSGIAESLKKYNNYEVYYLDILGEFSKFNDGKNLYVRFLKINHLVPNTGKLSKFIIFFLALLSLPFLIYQTFIKKPDIIMTGLVGFIPCLIKVFFPKLKIINSIQGYPKFNFLRKVIWKLFYSKSDLIITMTKKTKAQIQEKLLFDDTKIYVVENPVITKKIKALSKIDIQDNEKFIFEKDVYCCIGRLTYQKNFLELLNFFKDINLNKNDFNLIIIGEGEQKKKLEKFIILNEIKNCFLLGFKNNPYSYLSRSKLYISNSLWEEPGHTLLEAGYLNVPILSSNCPNGPEEIIINDFNGFKYELRNKDDFFKKFNEFKTMDEFKKKQILLNMKRVVMNYSKLRFSKKFSSLIN